MSTIAPGLYSPVVAGGAWSPRLLPGLKGWWDLSRRNALYQDEGGTTRVQSEDDPIGLVLDRSGSGNNIAQGSGALRPTYKPFALNGMACALHDTADVLDLPGAGSGWDGETGTWAAVVMRDAVDDANRFILSNYDAWGVDGVVLRFTTASVFQYGVMPGEFVFQNFGTAVASTATVVSIRWNADGGWARQDADSDNEDTTTTLPHTQSAAATARLAYQLDGYWSEIVHCTECLTANLTTKLHLYLMKKWGIS